MNEAERHLGELKKLLKELEEVAGAIDTHIERDEFAEAKELAKASYDRLVELAELRPQLDRSTLVRLAAHNGESAFQLIKDTERVYDDVYGDVLQDILEAATVFAALIGRARVHQGDKHEGLMWVWHALGIDEECELAIQSLKDIAAEYAGETSTAS